MVPAPSTGRVRTKGNALREFRHSGPKHRRLGDAHRHGPAAQQRLARLRAAVERSELGAVLAFDFSNIRYMTATHIGTWAVDKMIRFALLVRGGEPIVWDFGSAAKHSSAVQPWLDYSKAHSDGDPHAAHQRRRTPRNPSGAPAAGISTLRGAI